MLMLATRRCLTAPHMRLPVSHLLRNPRSTNPSSSAPIRILSTNNVAIQSASMTTATPSSQSQLPSLRISSGESTPDLQASVASLLRDTRYIIWDAHALHRTYRFATFQRAIQFITRISELAESSDHHPDIENSHRIVNLTWTTHRPAGLSSKDVAMARASEEIATELEVSETGPKPEGAPEFGPWEEDWTVAPTKFFRPPKTDAWAALRAPRPKNKSADTGGK